ARARGLNSKVLQLLKPLKDFQTRNIISLQSTLEQGDLSQVQSETSLRLFASSNTMIGLVPPNCQPGDIIVQLWNSSACAVLRRKPFTGLLSTAMIKRRNTN